jgi:Immunity protein 32
MGMRLSFEISADRQELVVSGDVDGLRTLVRTIERRIQNTRDGEFDHDHLMTPAWGGHELTTEPWAGEGFSVAHHVKLYCVKGERSAT